MRPGNVICMFVKESKDGFEVRVHIPGHLLSDDTGQVFHTEAQAEDYIVSPEGEALLQRFKDKHASART